jgi:hypothetical protein
MPVRSIKLKLVVPRGSAGASLRQALWLTHEEVNKATSYYEQRLLLMRALPYETSATDEGDKVTLEVIQRQALEVARTAQRENLDRAGRTGEILGTDAEVLSALRELFRRIAPDQTGAASAQAANAYVSPLVDPDSRGFGGIADRLARPLPNWLALSDDDPELLATAQPWFASDASVEWRTDTGSPSTWLRKARQGDPGWPALFRAKLDQMQRAIAEGPEAVIDRARSLALLPLFSPYFSPRMAERQGVVTPWDRLAMRLAVAHVLSWQAWVRRTAEQRAAREAQLADYRKRAVTPKIDELLPVIAQFEKDRSESLSRLGLGPSAYRLMPRQLRGWAELRQDWMRKGGGDPNKLRSIAAAHQTRLRGRFGDPQVFLWLADKANHRLWRDDDVPTVVATLNAMQALLDRSRETATMTLPDACLHPRAVQWSAEGDTNLRPYRLLSAGEASLEVELSLLAARDEDGKLKDLRHRLRLAPSGQLRSVRIEHRGKKAELAFADDSAQRFTGVLGSADLLLNRAHLGNRPEQRMREGDIGPVWLKLAVELDPDVPPAWGKDHARFARHFRAALGSDKGLPTAVVPGARVLSVDLGVRTFAACSVFTLKERPVSDGGNGASVPLAFRVPVGDATFWAVHERSFHLNLPDEAPDRDGEEWRRRRREELLRLRRALAFHRRALRLAGVAAQDRAEALEGLRLSLSDGDPFPCQHQLVASLSDRANAAQPVWDDAVSAALRGLRQELGPVVHTWRQTGKERQPFTYLGKSMWAVEYLTDVRRLLLSWSLLGRASGDVRRLDRAERGTFARHLLEHLDNVKEDRLKTGADLIVRAAMGQVRDHAGRWEQRFAPCDAVLFEDLSRYRMRTDRPRRENSQLMRWAHRAVPEEVAMQGALHTLAVEETSAAFSSRYCARTLTPGLRSQPLSRDDMSDAYLREELAQDGIDIDRCRPGDLVPRAGGKLFAYVTHDGRLSRIDADINAAQNLQRRFWTRHADAFRLPCVPAEVHGAPSWVPRQLGKRLMGALGGVGLLRPTGHESGSCRWEPARKAALRGVDVAGDAQRIELDEQAEELAGLAEEAEVTAGRVEVFFRDPSGVILPSNLWYPSRTFWGIVRTKTVAHLKARLGG